MSLLMKALASAEKEKKDKAQLEKNDVPSPSLELSLAPLESLNTSPDVVNLEKNAPQMRAQPKKIRLTPVNSHQKAAANMFTAAQLPQSHFSKVLWVLGFIAIVLAAWLGLALSSSDTDSPQILIAHDTSNNPAANVSNTAHLNTPALTQTPETEYSEKKLPNDTLASAAATINNAVKPHQKTNTKPSEITPPTENIPSFEENKPPQLTVPNDDKKSNQQVSDKPTEHHAMQLVSQKSSLSVDPVLLAAYEAFNLGEYAQAQQKYRQVLQKDVRNIDALLGMAAIAQKQVRNADAIGWYQKVLEIEPHHPIATAAVFNIQPNENVGSQISQLKNLIAQQPEVASYHAALGNIFAEQNEWLQAQAAYFDANRFAPNHADYVFNLAVSLEHLGKPALALSHYQRALALVEQAGALSPDRQIIKARIQALQK